MGSRESSSLLTGSQIAKPKLPILSKLPRLSVASSRNIIKSKAKSDFPTGSIRNMLSNSPFRSGEPGGFMSVRSRIISHLTSARLGVDDGSCSKTRQNRNPRKTLGFGVLLHRKRWPRKTVASEYGFPFERKESRFLCTFSPYRILGLHVGSPLFG